MTDTTASAQASGDLSGNVLFYDKPEPLSVELHGKLGVDPVEKPYGFVAKSNIVPLTVTEFAPAALSYPVIFLGDEKLPVAVMGLRQDDNLFVDSSGEFRSDAYIPAYVRRYPFVFANDDQQKRMILCLDRAAPFIKEGGQTPLFVNGQPSDYTKQAMEFCNSFEQERLRTESFVILLIELDLFHVREASFTPRNPDGTAGQPQKVAEYFAVDEEKLRALPAEKLAELRDNGALGQIYAHLVSLAGWDRLIAMAFQRANAMPTAANA
ncbi:peptidase [Brevundimonas sp. S30B]|uniref:SapC family protein n=1 Tax=unclassified Brevundimonas TaxID=2622653 RepID=UPI0010729771|nr:MULTISPECIES: SapC family protein [unclassified Brevundimonas]QBX36627.1 peptidase [Brevundimonas sp. MF30-B]TFW04578.1 peptidase [Brevundimonas sp. S30B]